MNRRSFLGALAGIPVLLADPIKWEFAPGVKVKHAISAKEKLHALYLEKLVNPPLIVYHVTGGSFAPGKVTTYFTPYPDIPNGLPFGM